MLPQLNTYLITKAVTRETLPIFMSFFFAYKFTIFWMALLVACA